MTGRTTGLRMALTILITCVIAAACGADADEVGDTSAAEPIPTQAADVITPASTAAELAIPDGAEVYQQYCAECHGVGLRGTDEGPSQLSIIYEPNHHGDYAYRVAIREGTREHHWWFGDMPPVEGISDLEIEKVISFIRAEQQRLGFEE